MERKIERKYASNKNLTKTSKKFSFLKKMLACDDCNKKIYVIFKILLAFLKFFKLLGMCHKFHVVTIRNRLISW